MDLKIKNVARSKNNFGFDCSNLIKLFRLVIKPYYVSTTINSTGKANQRVHGINFYTPIGSSSPTTAFIMCTLNNKILYSDLTTCNIPIPEGNPIYGSNGNGDCLLSFPIGLTYNTDNTYIYVTNYTANINQRTQPTFPDIVYFSPTERIIRAVSISYARPNLVGCIDGANGSTIVKDINGSTNVYLYINSFNNSKLVKAVFINKDHVLVLSFVDIPVCHPNKGAPGPSLNAGIVQTVPFPNYSNDPKIPEKILLCCRTSSQILKYNLSDDTVERCPAFASSSNGLYYPPFCFPNTFDSTKFTHVLASNNSYLNLPNVPKLIKLNRRGRRLPFIPNCVMNYFFKEIRQAVVIDGYYYIASGSPTQGSSAVGGTIFRIKIFELNQLLQIIYGPKWMIPIC